MSVLSMSSSRSLPETELEHITQLAVSLSGQLTSVQVEEIGPAGGAALQCGAAAAPGQGGQFLEVSESGIARTHLPTRPTNAEVEQHQPSAPPEWLLARLQRGEVVAISRAEDLPREARVIREQTGGTGVCCILGVPVSMAGRVVFALVLDSDRVTPRWPYTHI